MAVWNMAQNFRRLRRRFLTIYSILDSKNAVFEAPRRRRKIFRGFELFSIDFTIENTHLQHTNPQKFRPAAENP